MHIERKLILKGVAVWSNNFNCFCCWLFILLIIKYSCTVTNRMAWSIFYIQSIDLTKENNIYICVHISSSIVSHPIYIRMNVQNSNHNRDKCLTLLLIIEQRLWNKIWNESADNAETSHKQLSNRQDVETRFDYVLLFLFLSSYEFICCLLSYRLTLIALSNHSHFW